MNSSDLLKKMLPGFIPILVFIVADEIWGTKIGMYVAVGFGLIQFSYILLKEKRIDKFILFDTLLIVALGSVSIILDNDLFFKLKPALINLILCILLGFSIFSKHNIFMLMGQRYMKNVSLNEQAIKQFQKNLKIFLYVLITHTILIIYSAYYMSNEAWAFISGALIYILFGFIFVIQIIGKRFLFKKNTEEWFPIVDEDGKVIGKATRSACHSDNTLLHPVVHLHVFNEKGELFLQKRPTWKDIQPDKWDTAVGGHVDLNEKIEDALFREAGEEINLKNFHPQFIRKYIWKSDKESELVFSFLTVINEQITINKNELADGRFWKITDIKAELKNNLFTPNFVKEFEFVKNISIKLN